MSKIKPVPRAVWLAGVAALTLVIATAGGWRLPLRARGGLAPGGVAAQAPGEHPQVGGSQAGQRSGQARTREPEPLPPSRWPWWKDAALQKEVGLTSRQVERIDAIYQQRATELAPYLEEWRKQEAELNRMAREREVSVETFAIQVARVDTLRSKLGESRTVMLYRMSRELTDAQYKKLQEYLDRGRGGGRGGGRSGPQNW